MQLLKSFSLFLLAAVVLADGDVEQPKELKIDTTYLPQNCVEKAKTGDAIQVHYVSWMGIEITID